MDILTPFQKKALAYNKHISLTANAGSGKTTVLAKRYVEILKNENISINNIIAITFTDKAAAELYSKIAAELDRKIENSRTKKQKLENIRRSLVSAKISTIHSFCIDILKDYAPEAGIDANFLPIDSRIAEELLEQSIDESISINLNHDLEEIKYLIRVFGNRSQLIKNTKQLFGKRKTVEYLIEKVYNKNTEEVAEWFNSKLQKYVEQYFPNIIDHLIQSIIEVNDLIFDNKNNQTKEKINELISTIIEQKEVIRKLKVLNEIGRIILTGKGTIRIKGYLSPKLYKTNEDLLKRTESLFKEINFFQFEENDDKSSQLAKFGKWILNFYNDVNARYTGKKQQRSFLDFEDLLLYTQKLTLNPDIQKDLSSKYKYIMIDEYQDTNEIQYKIFMPILNNLDSGNLFIVGDEKQSIYRFREAEVELFHKTRDEIKGYDNLTGVLELPHSFRLTPNLALFTNLIFGRIFDSLNKNYNEVEYNDLICAYNGNSSGEIEFLISDGLENKESDLVAKKILQEVNDSSKQLNFEDFTLLCTKRKYFFELEETFSKYNIPFNIVGGKGFFQQQMVLDVYSYLSFLVNEKNDLALASILRGPFYGLSDVELTDLCLLEGNSLFEKLSISEEFDNIYKRLNEHLKLSKTLNTNQLIRKITNETGFWTYTAAKSNGPQEVANLKKLIQKSIDEESKGFTTLYDFTQYLKKAIYNIEDEGQADIDITTNAVNIMTVHQSKGLEFKVVILYKTNRKSIDERLKSKEVVVDKDFGLLSKLPDGNNFFEEYENASIVDMYNFLQKKKSQEEFKRLLYVAVTRAEEKLIISAEIQKKIWPDSFADMIFRSLNINMNSESFSISGNLEFMKFEEGNYSLYKENIVTNVPIIKHLNSFDEQPTDDLINRRERYRIYLDSKEYREKNEIISASKISLFLNCPRKYELTYEFGYGELIKSFKAENDFELNYKEDTDSISSNTLGTVLHAFLKNDTSTVELNNEFDKIVRSEDLGYIIDTEEKDKILKESFKILNNFYETENYARIKKYPQFFNEIEFYKREHDYFLYGIVDKLILNDNNIIIIDYKSDIVNDENIDEKIETYLNQLMFYAYIISSKYPNAISFDLMILFLRDDRYSFSDKVSRNSVRDFGNIIKESVSKIRDKEFSEKKKGCENLQNYLLPEK